MVPDEILPVAIMIADLYENLSHWASRTHELARSPIQ